MEALINRLKHINSLPISERYNICFYFDSAAMRSQFIEICKMWPKYSGYEPFPVPSGATGVISPCEAFIRSNFTQGWVGQYGKNRQELLEFAIQHLEENKYESKA